MSKIKEFFRRDKYTPIMHVLTGMLLLMAILSAMFWQWLNAACCMLWMFVQYQSYRVHEQNIRALEFIDTQEKMIKVMLIERELSAEKTATTHPNKPIPGAAYERMPDVFTRDELKQQLKERNIQSPHRKYIYRWKKAGLITEPAKDIFVKTIEEDDRVLARKLERINK